MNPQMPLQRVYTTTGRAEPSQMGGEVIDLIEYIIMGMKGSG